MSTYPAITVPFFGDPDVLHLDEFELPPLEEDELLVKVIASSINPIDCKTRAGLGWAAEQNKDKLPMILGYDLAGVVAAVGSEALREWSGNLVVGMIGFPQAAGCYAAYRKVKVNEVVSVPSQISTMQAAGLPLAGLTAWQALFKHGRLMEGQSVLVLGATGGVGHFAAQLARDAGAKVFITGSNEKIDRMDLVFDGCKPIELAALQGKSFDLVVDNLGGDMACQVIESLLRASRWVTLPSVTKAQVSQACQDNNICCVSMLVEPNLEQLQQLLALISQDRLRVHIDMVEDYKRISLLHRALESRQVAGKCLIRFD